MIWLFLLHVLNKSKLNFWYFLVGSAGVFVLMLVFLQPYLTQPLARIVALLAGLPGKIGDIYSAHYKYGVIFVQTYEGADYGVSLTVDLLSCLYGV